MIAEFFRLTKFDLHSAFNDAFEKQYRQILKLKPLKHEPAIVREIREYCVTLKRGPHLVKNCNHHPWRLSF